MSRSSVPSSVRAPSASPSHERSLGPAVIVVGSGIGAGSSLDARPSPAEPMARHAEGAPESGHARSAELLVRPPGYNSAI
jgi:hypothetical protein